MINHEKIIKVPKKGYLLFNLGYITSLNGAFKFLEGISLLLAWTLTANFQGHFTFSYTTFFLITASLGSLYVVVFYIVYLLSGNKLVNSTWPFVSLYFEANMSVLLLISSSLQADLSRRLLDKTLTPFYCVQTRILSTCGHLVAASIFGFLASLLFAVDSYFHFKQYENHYSTHVHFTKIESS